MSNKRTISLRKAKGVRTHNNRTQMSANVDASRTADNIIWIDEPLEDAYEKLFAEAVLEHDAKQSRACRRYGSAAGYLKDVQAKYNKALEKRQAQIDAGEKTTPISVPHPYYELLFEIGDSYNCAVGTEDGKKAQAILEEYIAEFRQRNPNLYVYQLIMHLDESTPHIHLQYVPVAHDATKKLSVRNALRAALEEQGFAGKKSRFDNATIRWEKAEREHMAAVMRRHGWEWDDRSAQRSPDRKDESIAEVRRRGEELRKERESYTTPLPEPKLIGKTTISNKQLIELRERDRQALHILDALANADALSIAEQHAARETQKAAKAAEQKANERTRKANAYGRKIQVQAKALKAREDELAQREAAVDLKYKELVERDKNLKGSRRTLTEIEQTIEWLSEALRGTGQGAIADVLRERLRVLRSAIGPTDLIDLDVDGNLISGERTVAAVAQRHGQLAPVAGDLAPRLVDAGYVLSFEGRTDGTGAVIARRDEQPDIVLADSISYSTQARSLVGADVPMEIQFETDEERRIREDVDRERRMDAARRLAPRLREILGLSVDEADALDRALAGTLLTHDGYHGCDVLIPDGRREIATRLGARCTAASLDRIADIWIPEHGQSAVEQLAAIRQQTRQTPKRQRSTWDLER